MTDGAPGPVARPTSAHRPPDGVRFVYIAILVMWLVFPFAVRGNLAQDAVPFVVAGELARSQPDAIYPTQARDLYDLPPAFSQRSCAISPPGTDCANLNVAFVSPPPALVVAVPLAALGPDLAVLGFRLLAAAALAGGMWVLWRRLASRTPRAPTLLVATALVLTPFVVYPIALGQTSPLLFLSASLGITGSVPAGGDDTGRRRPRPRDAGPAWAALVALVWVATVALKVFPIALVLVLLWQRRWMLLAWSGAFAAAFLAVTAALVPATAYDAFLTGSRSIGGFLFDDRYNVSWDAAVHQVSAAPAMTAVSLALRVLGVLALAWFVMRRADADAQWAWAWAALLVFVPLVWLHYEWVLVATVAVLLSSCRSLDDKLVVALPATALVLLALLAVDGRGGAAAALPAVLLVAVLVGGPWLLATRGGLAAEPSTT